MVLSNKDLRRKIVDMVVAGRDGHIPSAFSIVDIIERIYAQHLRFQPNNPDWPGRDYFILSKGHGCLALYVVLEKFGTLTKKDLKEFCTHEGILGEHPDATKVPGVEASTGSLGHGFPFAVGIALAAKIQEKTCKVFTLTGDGECHEGTMWEAANIAANQRLGNLCVIVDWNKSGAQLMPIDDLPSKWAAFGFDVQVINGHDADDIDKAMQSITYTLDGRPHVILAHTVKGCGVPLIEGHGPWHHKIPNALEYAHIMEALA